MEGYNGRHTFPRDFIVGDWPWKGEVLHAEVPCLGSIKADVVDNGSIQSGVLGVLVRSISPASMGYQNPGAGSELAESTQPGLAVAHQAPRLLARNA